ncbi:glycosyltransferase [Peribacillus frigoritolerans]|uniref:glycosyltransferase n=1 Tax=Peribacillus frigoritolerans TaxID=450367 RepID=UPI0020BE645D|nr:glycosyltransferase [Peribacillus frigoritolerans]
MSKKIAFIIPALTGGGAERVVANLTKGLPSNYEKFIIIYHTTDKSYEHNGRIINLNIGSSDNKFGKIINTIRRIVALKKIKKKYKIDRSISFLENPNLINIFSKGNEDVFVSIRNHQSSEFTGITKIINKVIVKFCYSKADKIVAISNGVKNDLIENFGVKSKEIETIYNPVDIERINNLKTKPLEEKYRKIYKNPTIITVGRLTYQKGQWHLIRAFKKVVEKVPNVQLVIVGTGMLEEQLKQLIADLNLTNNIHFTGFQDNPFKFIHLADMFILPSLFEGLGNVLLEAMACETPIISTDCQSGPREILAPSTNLNTELNNYSIEEYGVLIPVLNGNNIDSNQSLTPEEELLGKAILLLLNNKELAERLKINGIKRVNEFSFEKISKQWVDL